MFHLSVHVDSIQKELRGVREQVVKLKSGRKKKTKKKKHY